MKKSIAIIAILFRVIVIGASELGDNEERESRFLRCLAQFFLL